MKTIKDVLGTPAIWKLWYRVSAVTAGSICGFSANIPEIIFPKVRSIMTYSNIMQFDCSGIVLLALVDTISTCIVLSLLNSGAPVWKEINNLWSVWLGKLSTYLKSFVFVESPWENVVLSLLASHLNQIFFPVTFAS